MSRSPLHLREFARIYEMLELEVTYSRSRIVSTSCGAALKKGGNSKTSLVLTILFFVEGAFQPCTFTSCLLLISTMRIIQSGILCLILYFPSFLSCRPSFLFAVLSMRFIQSREISFSMQIL